MKINTRETVLITLAVLVLIPIVALAGINWWVLSTDEEFDRSKHLQNALHIAYTSYNQDKINLQNTVRNLSFVLDHFDFEQGRNSSAELHDLLMAIKATSSLDILTVVDKDKRVIARANTTTQGDVLTTPWFLSQASSGKTLVSPVIVADSDISAEGEELLSQTAVFAIQYGMMDVSAVVNPSGGIFLYAVSPIYGIENGNNRIIAYTVGAKLITEDYLHVLGDLKSLIDINVGIQPANEIILPDTDKAFLPIEDLEGKPIANMVVWYDPSKYANLITESQETTMLIYLVAIIFILYAAMKLTNHLVKPLEKLNLASRKVANGYYDIELKPQGPKEFQSVIKTFNAMTSKLAENKKMQENFIATLTHDMRVPLIAEKKAIDLILTDERFELPEMQSVLIENMKSSNEGLLSLVNRLLDIFKLRAGAYRLHKEKHNIIDVINNSVNELQPLLDEKSQEFTLNAESDTVEFTFDKTEIKRVITNILSNAIKFSPEEQVIKMNVYNDEEKVLLTIKDNGIGMTEEETKELFKMYTSSSSKLKEIGTGLGLYLSYSIIKAHQGDVWVESQVGDGTTFYISLPV